MVILWKKEKDKKSYEYIGQYFKSIDLLKKVKRSNSWFKITGAKGEMYGIVHGEEEMRRWLAKKNYMEDI